MNQATLKAPFPYFGGKRRVADLVWQRFGEVRNYVEPFAGSLAVLLARPLPFVGVESVNDKDCYLANFWRALQADPESVASYANWPVNEVDLSARHQWLVNQADFRERMAVDPDYYDAKIAGWWAWGLCCWIGSGWCRNAGQGVNRQLPHLGDAGRGVHRKLPHLGDAGRGERLLAYFDQLAARLRSVRVACGEWRRVLGPSVTVKHGTTAVFLDPPYGCKRDTELYRFDCLRVSGDVRKWCLEHGDDESLRIALCGYEGEHKMPRSWTCVKGKAGGGHGYGGQNGKGYANRDRERIWFSPACLKAVPA